MPLLYFFFVGILFSQTPEKLLEDGNSELQNGNLNLAEDLFNKALKISHFYLDKNLENVSSDLSILNYFNVKKINIFISDDKIEIQSFFLFSIFLRKILFFDYSIYLLKKLINIDKNNYIYLFHLGKAYQGQEKFKYAIKYLKFSLKNKSDLEDAINSLAVCLIEIGKYDEAEKILMDGIKKNKNNKFFYSNLGKIYNETEQFNKSIKFYNLGLDIDSSICREFQKNSQDKNYLFSIGIEMVI